MRPLVYKWLWLTIGIVLVVFVIAMSLWPSPIEVLPETLADKVGHMIAYFTLMLWFAGLWPRRRHLWWCIFFILMGVCLEGMQGFVDIRVTDLLDVGANVLGILMGLAMARIGLDRWSVWLERCTPRGRAAHG